MPSSSSPCANLTQAIDHIVYMGKGKMSVRIYPILVIDLPNFPHMTLHMHRFTKINLFVILNSIALKYSLNIDTTTSR